MASGARILVYGYGNPGRQDDGLGNAFVDAMQAWAEQQGLRNLRFDSNYQLNIEDADNIAGQDIVLFVDASQEEIEDVILTDVLPNAKVEFTMHAVSPGFVLELCEKLYADPPRAFLLHIKGYEWELKEGLSPEASKNLNKALDLVKPMLLNPSLFEKFNQ
jgi:hydrogenase maturation protease